MNAVNRKLGTLMFIAGSLAAGVAIADEAASELRRNGEHPVIIQNRLIAKAGYDYASKFYLHPARLTLLAEPPRELGEHPAVIVAREAARAARAAREQTQALCAAPCAERLVQASDK